eukprot:2605642-Prymnesium_polylepis.1
MCPRIALMHVPSHRPRMRPPACARIKGCGVCGISQAVALEQQGRKRLSAKIAESLEIAMAEAMAVADAPEVLQAWSGRPCAPPPPPRPHWPSSASFWLCRRCPPLSSSALFWLCRRCPPLSSSASFWLCRRCPPQSEPPSTSGRSPARRARRRRTTTTARTKRRRYSGWHSNSHCPLCGCTSHRGTLRPPPRRCSNADGTLPALCSA